jgi:hypothetical protein
MDDLIKNLLVAAGSLITAFSIGSGLDFQQPLASGTLAIGLYLLYYR